MDDSKELYFKQETLERYRLPGILRPIPARHSQVRSGIGRARRRRVGARQITPDRARMLHGLQQGGRDDGAVWQQIEPKRSSFYGGAIT